MDEIGLFGELYGGTGPLYAVAYLLGTDGEELPLEARQYLSATNGAAETFNAQHWPLYALPLTLATDGNWYASFPVAAADGNYWVEVWEQEGSAAVRSADLDLDAGGVVVRNLNPPKAADAFADDWAGMLDFAEPLIYKAYDDKKNLIGTYEIDGVVDRQAPELVSETSHELTDSIQICIANATPVTQIREGRDKITVTGRWGGNPSDHLVVAVLGSDAGVWTLRVKGN